MDKETAECVCEYPEQWAHDPHFPVERDNQTGEYQIVHGPDNGWRFIMQFCPWCGGRLPSQRGSLFTRPVDREVAEIESLLANVKSADGVFQRLGPPDEIHEWDESFCLSSGPADKVLKWRRLFRYQKRWATVQLDVLEMPDGLITLVIGGKYTGQAPSAC